jgi:hypothetical protein
MDEDNWDDEELRPSPVSYEQLERELDVMASLFNSPTARRFLDLTRGPDGP